MLTLKTVYLSGAMDGKPDLNRAAFAEEESAAYDQGADWVFNPCEYYRIKDQMPDWPRGKFMRNDMRALLDADVLVALDDADESRGARLEMMVAQACGIEIMRASDLA